MVRGTSIHELALPARSRSVLFVCKGNICRSPFAEHVARKLFHDLVGDAKQSIAFQSAGLHVTVPKAPQKTAIVVAHRFGVSLEEHRSQPISQELVAASDVIVAMEGWQYDELRSRFKVYKDKICLLSLFFRDAPSRFGYDAFNIRDPYGGSQNTFEECFEKIERAVKVLLVECGVKE